MSRTWIFWLAALILGVLFLFCVRSILLPFVVGMMTAYFLDPTVDQLERRGLSRITATSIVTVVFFMIVASVFVLIAPFIVEQGASLAASIPKYIDNLRATLQQYGGKISSYVSAYSPNGTEGFASDIGKNIGAYVAEFLGGLVKSGFAVVNLLSLLFIAPVVAFYWLKDWDRFTAKCELLFPEKYSPVIKQQFREIDDILSGYIRGQTLVCLLLATFYALGLTFAGLNFGFIIGLATGILAFIPYVGLLIGMSIGLLTAFFQFDEWYRTLIVLLIFVSGQFIEGNFITPKIVGEKVKLHPIWIIFGLLAGGALFGFTGVLIAVPVTAVIGVLARFALARYLSSPLHHTPPSSGERG